MTTVLLHGAGLSASCWEGLAARHPALIAPSLPGRPEGAPCESVEAMAAWLEATLPRGPLTLVGHSMGGAVAMTLALRGRVDVARLVLVSTGARLRVNPAILAVVDANQQLDVVGLCGHPSAEPGAHDRIRASAGMVSAAAAAADWHACDSFDVRAHVGAIRAPTVVWVGEDDVVTPPRYAAWLAEQVPGATLRVVPGAGHLWALEGADAFLAPGSA